MLKVYCKDNAHHLKIKSLLLHFQNNNNKKMNKNTHTAKTEVKPQHYDNSFQLDSFKIRIQLSKVKIINQSLLGYWMKVNSKTGEVLESQFKSDAYPIQDKGIKTMFAIEKQMTNRKEVNEFFIILLNAKLLKDRYLEGITKNNIKQIYNELIDFNQAEFSYNDFLLGELTDVDFKKDLKTNTIDKLTRGLEALTKSDKRDTCKVYHKKDNKGIQWSRRDETNLTRPFIKLYHKGISLRRDKNNIEFYENFILGTDKENQIDDRVRIEFTIKNKKHFRSFDVNSTTLNDILELNRQTKDRMFKNSIYKHINTDQIKPMRIKENLPANDKIILKSIDMILQTDQYTINHLVDVLIEDIPNRSQRSKKKQELRSLIETRLKLTKLKKHLKFAELRNDILKILFS